MRVIENQKSSNEVAYRRAYDAVKILEERQRFYWQHGLKDDWARTVQQTAKAIEKRDALLEKYNGLMGFTNYSEY